MDTGIIFLKFIFQLFLAAIYVNIFTYLVTVYIGLFGDAYTAMDKIIFVYTCLLLSMLIIFSINYFVRTDNLILGIMLGCGLFSHYYIFRHLDRVPEVILLTLISFPVNINMLSMLLLPILTGVMLNKSFKPNTKSVSA